MQLSQLLGSTQDVRVIGDGATDIRGLALDSRAVRPGYLFAALAGEKADGRDFIPDALVNGAVAVLIGPDAVDTVDAVLVRAANPRRAFSLMAAAFYGAQPATVVAVTGTNGKTSVASFTRQLWQALGKKAASIGTLGIEGDGPGAAAGLTTPDPVSLHKALSEMAAAGVDHAVIEASSHGLSQYRLDGVRVSIAAFTNLTRDHLDYHRTTDDYLAAKLRLFTEVLAEDGIAVVNTDSQFARNVCEAAAGAGREVFTVGRGDDVRLHYSDPVAVVDGQSLSATCDGRQYDLSIPLFGRFQVENAMLAAAGVIASGEDAGRVFAALGGLTGAPGRFELAGETASGVRVFVDYAHTPDGLKNILTAARTITDGRLLVVFGCGGDRDAGKRPQMGAIAADLADDVYVTDDNPRGENPADIRAQILVATPGAREFDDRATAIEAAVAEAEAGDVVLVTGKGHEMGQIIAGKTIPYDDFSAVSAAIAAANEGIADAV